MRFACRMAAKHLTICLVIALVSSAIVYWGWYPFPYAAMLGVTKIFLLAIAIDVICGPLLTLILSNPLKSRRERWIDFSLIGCIQLAALIYAMHSIYTVRPVVLAFEKDRYVVVSANEVQRQKMSEAPESYRDLPFFGTLNVGTRSPRNSDEFFSSAEMSLAGITPAMRPDWWVSPSENFSEIDKRAKPLSELINKSGATSIIVASLKIRGKDASKLKYLPFTSASEKDWIVIFENPFEFIDYLPIDGF